VTFFGLGVTRFVAATGTAGAAMTGAGIGGNALVFTCAMAVVAIVKPKTNQQFVFINLKSEF
jgi:galactokinase